MNMSIADELKTFERLCQPGVGAGISVKRLAEHAWLFTPQRIVASPPQKAYALTIAALVHGNEVAGLAVVTDLLRYIFEQPSLLQTNMVIMLGNVAAAHQNKRFVDRDLNRSFLSAQASTQEDRRAQVLAPILKDSAYFVDLHQTTEPAVSPFFIFPYTPKSFELARLIHPRLPVVTHWGAPFSEDGGCTDEYVNKMGGAGLSIELGQNGFAPQHVSTGLWACLQGLSVVPQLIQGQRLSHSRNNELFTWGETIDWPADGHGLVPGWYNFQDVQAGQRLGGSDRNPIVAKVSGKILFPKYWRDRQGTPPKELCRIIRPITEQELGT